MEYSERLRRAAHSNARRQEDLRIPLTKYGLSTVLWGTALLFAGAAVSTLVSSWVALLPWAILWAGMAWFFRDPERTSPSSPDCILSPADGTVRDVGQVSLPAFLEGPALRVGIFMSLFDVHVNRSPADGTVRWTSYHRGSFHDARAEAALAENEHNLLGLELEDGRRIVVNQIAGVLARRIVCSASLGDILRRGQRFGMVKFGSRVELYLPACDQYDVLVKPGDDVRAGSTVVAVWRGRARQPLSDAHGQSTG